MAIPLREQRILQQKSGNLCAFPNCPRELTSAPGPDGRVALLGEMAHIVGESHDGPRGDHPLPLDERNTHTNLVLLCNNHHQLIDDPDQLQTYTVEWLRGIKDRHEQWVAKTLGLASGAPPLVQRPPRVTETLYSNLFPVEQVPRYIYGVPCAVARERDIILPRDSLRQITTALGPRPELEMAPFIVRGGMLFAFQDLTEEDNPFRDWVQGQAVERFAASAWWDDPDRMRWYIDLMNRGMNKLTGRRGLHLDREHRRYYFQPGESGKEVTISYRSLNGRRARRTVVWQPTKKSTGEGRGYWLHRAVALRFTRSDAEHWFLGVRPELRATVDGYQTLPAEKIGSKVTREKARRFNYDLLSEVHFWRDYLSESKPRAILHFGSKQRIVISTTPLHGDVTWPGIPAEHAKPFTHVEYVDDLLTWAEVTALQGEDDGPDWDSEEDTDDADDEE